MALTVKKVQRALRKGEPGRFLDGVRGGGVRGLYLAVDGRTAASWTLRYQLDGKAHWMGLGSARDFTLEQARQRAREARQRLADGTDPIQAKRAARAEKLAAAAATKTFKECAADFIEGRRHEWRSAVHEIQWTTTLRQYVYPIIGGLDVAKVDRPSVLRVLEQHVPALRGRPAGKFWLTRTVTADRVRNRIELILNWAVARGYRPAGGENPAAWNVLSHVLPRPSKAAPKTHHPALPYADVPALMGELRKHEGVSVQALQFLILTAARAGEVLGATWGEIDLPGKVWTIPAARMKSGKEHKVPLSAAAIELLRHAYTEDGNPFVFIGTGKQRLSAEALGKALARIRSGEPTGSPSITVHGFRSSFSDWAHERTAHANLTIEMSLAHAVGGAVEQAYRRTDLFNKRRQLVDAWGVFCTSTPIEAASVVPMRPAVEASS